MAKRQTNNNQLINCLVVAASERAISQKEHMGEKQTAMELTAQQLPRHQTCCGQLCCKLYNAVHSPVNFCPNYKIFFSRIFNPGLIKKKRKKNLIIRSRKIWQSTPCFPAVRLEKSSKLLFSSQRCSFTQLPTTSPRHTTHTLQIWAWGRFHHILYWTRNPLGTHPSP